MNSNVVVVGGGKLFEVAHLSVVGDKYVVNLDTQDCSCRKWMITGIPCCHALAAIRFLNLNAKDYIPLCFRKSSFEEMYNSIIYPINGQNMWPTTDFLDGMPPRKRIMPGRPKKKRRLEQWELRKDDTQLRKGGHRKRYRVCRELGHNRRHCPQLPTQVQSSQPTDAPPQPTQPSQEPPIVQFENPV